MDNCKENMSKRCRICYNFAVIGATWGQLAFRDELDSFVCRSCLEGTLERMDPTARKAEEIRELLESGAAASIPNTYHAGWTKEKTVEECLKEAAELPLRSQPTMIAGGNHLYPQAILDLLEIKNAEINRLQEKVKSLEWELDEAMDEAKYGAMERASRRAAWES